MTFLLLVCAINGLIAITFWWSYYVDYSHYNEIYSVPTRFVKSDILRRATWSLLRSAIIAEGMSWHLFLRI